MEKRLRGAAERVSLKRVFGFSDDEQKAVLISETEVDNLPVAGFLV